MFKNAWFTELFPTIRKISKKFRKSSIKIQKNSKKFKKLNFPTIVTRIFFRRIESIEQTIKYRVLRSDVLKKRANICAFFENNNLNRGRHKYM